MTTAQFPQDSTQALQDILDPGFDGFLPETFDDWMPSIKDEDLRAAVLKNPRFQSRLTTHAYQKHHIRADLPIGEYPQQDMLLLALQADPSDLICRVGCVWHAGVLAMAATQGQLVKVLPDISLETIRWALRTNLHRKDSSTDTSDLTRLVTTDGRLCIAAWFATLRPQLRARIALTSHLPHQISDAQAEVLTLEPDDHTARTNTVLSCLAAMAKDT